MPYTRVLSLPFVLHALPSLFLRYLIILIGEEYTFRQHQRGDVPAARDDSCDDNKGIEVVT
jgi:hypothetical protein